jgi:crossover junction endodeoxyribonuclease RuvC
VLGVDPGTRRVGYGLVDVARRGKIRYIECGVIQVRARDDLPARIHGVAHSIAELIVDFSPVILAVEQAFHGVNVASALRLGEARGAILHVGVDHGLVVVEYAPAHVKRAVVGHGRAPKTDVQHRVSVLCGLRRVPAPDAADALAVALCHGQHLLGGAATWPPVATSP